MGPRGRPTRPALPGALLSLVALPALFACDRDAAGPPCVAPDDGAPVVENRGPGAWEGDAPSLVPLWRRGGTHEGEELAMPADASVSRSGRLAVVDFGLAELTVIEPDGTWHEPWATRGNGPGELSAPVAVEWASDDTAVVFDIGASRLERIAADGARSDAIPSAFVSDVVASGEVLWAAVDARGTAYLEAPYPLSSRQDTRTYQIVRQPRGEDEDTLLQMEVPVVPLHGRAARVPGYPEPVAAVAGDRVYRAATDGRYTITELDANGRPVRHICRAAEALPLTASQRGEGPVPEGREEWASAIAAAPRPDAPASVGRLVAGPGGELWVQRERPDPVDPDARMYGMPGATHDVFAPDGRYRGTIVLPDGFRLQAVLGDTIWGFRRGGLDEIWVEAFALRRP